MKGSVPSRRQLRCLGTSRWGSRTALLRNELPKARQQNPKSGLENTKMCFSSQNSNMDTSVLPSSPSPQNHPEANTREDIQGSTVGMV